MKILYLIRTMDVGGAERFTYNLANHFSNKFEKVSIYCSPGIFVKELESKNIKFFLSRYARRRGFCFTLKIFFELKKILSREPFDIIHCQQRIFLILVNLIYRNKHRPRIIYTANNFFDDRIQRFLSADIMIGVSPRITQNLIVTLPAKNKDIININYGVQIQKLSSEAYKSSFTIGFVGRIIKDKGIYTIFESIKFLLRSYQNIKMIFRGTGKEKSNLEKLINQFRLDNYFEFLSPLPDLSIT